MKIRFIHTADLHLDTPFKGLSEFNKALADKLKDASFQAFRNIIDCCIVKKVDFLLIAGDIFDTEERSIQAQIRFVTELKRLSGAGIPAYFVCGNHDFLGSWLDTLQIPGNTIQFGSSLDCESFHRDRVALADIYGISFGTKAVTENLAARYERKGNPAPISIAICHGTIGPAGAHHNYAPFHLSDIQDKQFDYWALGHIHKRAIIHDAYPAVVYPGNPQGRDFGESGEKGCYLVEIEPGQPPQLLFIPTQVVRFEKIQIDLAGIESIDRLPPQITNAIRAMPAYDERVSCIVQITLTGKTRLHAQLRKPGEIDGLRSLIMNEGQLLETPFMWIDRIEANTRPDINMDEIEKGNDFAAELVKLFDNYSDDAAKRTTLLQSLSEELLSAPIKREIVPLSPEDEKDLIERAKWLVLDQILTELL